MPPRRLLGSSRRLGATLASLGLSAGLLGACAPTREPFGQDPRACPRTNVELDDVLDHFALDLPQSATEVRYFGDVNPMFGDYFVQLRFSAPRGEVSSFLAAAEQNRQEGSHSPSLSPPDECLGLETFAPTSFVADYGPGSSLRELAVEDGDRTLSVVYLSAMDHP